MPPHRLRRSPPGHTAAPDGRVGWRGGENCAMTARCRGRGAATIRDRGRFAMTSPLMRAVGDRRSGRRALAMAFAFLLFAGAGLPVRAADDDAYSVTVKIDASNDAIGKARDAARLDGQRRALTTLADRLSGGNGAAKLPKLDAQAITHMVFSFHVAHYPIP